MREILAQMKCHLKPSQQTMKRASKIELVAVSSMEAEPHPVVCHVWILLVLFGRLALLEGRGWVCRVPCFQSLGWGKALGQALGVSHQPVWWGGEAAAAARAMQKWVFLPCTGRVQSLALSSPALTAAQGTAASKLGLISGYLSTHRSAFQQQQARDGGSPDGGSSAECQARANGAALEAALLFPQSHPQTMNLNCSLQAPRRLPFHLFVVHLQIDR